MKPSASARQAEHIVPYSKSLAERVERVLGKRTGIEQKRMFGGVGILLYGNMLVGVWQDSLIVRVGPEAYAAALARPHAREFDVTGRPMKGWVLVEPDGIERDEALGEWVGQAVEFVRTLPPK